MCVGGVAEGARLEYITQEVGWLIARFVAKPAACSHWLSIANHRHVAVPRRTNRWPARGPTQLSIGFSDSISLRDTVDTHSSPLLRADERGSPDACAVLRTGSCSPSMFTPVCSRPPVRRVKLLCVLTVMTMIH